MQSDISYLEERLYSGDIKPDQERKKENERYWTEILGKDILRRIPQKVNSHFYGNKVMATNVPKDIMELK